MIIRFDAPAQTSGSGTATLDFHGPPDTAIGFAAGGRSVTFPIAPGDVQAVLPFQTGTSSGVLTFTAQIGDANDQQNVAIAAAPPGIATAQVIRSAGSVEIRVTGFDNTRTLGTLSFTFYGADGAAGGAWDLTRRRRLGLRRLFRRLRPRRRVFATCCIPGHRGWCGDRILRGDTY